MIKKQIRIIYSLMGVSFWGVQLLYLIHMNITGRIDPLINFTILAIVVFILSAIYIFKD